jgi:hypothetical protein
MGFEIEGQNHKEYQEIKSRENQMENISKINQVIDMVDNINMDDIIQDTTTIKNIVVENLENQTNLDDVIDAINKVSRGITDIKRSQTNLNKKIKELEEKIGE